MWWVLYSDIFCNVQIPSTRNSGTHTFNDLSLVETKMIHRAKREIIVETWHFIGFNHWFLKKDGHKIMISLPITSIELYTPRLAFKFEVLREITAFMSRFCHKTFYYWIICISNLINSCFRSFTSVFVLNYFFINQPKFKRHTKVPSLF